MTNTLMNMVTLNKEVHRGRCTAEARRMLGTSRSRNGIRRALMRNMSAEDYVVKYHLDGVTFDTLFTCIGKGDKVSMGGGIGTKKEATGYGRLIPPG